MNRFWEDLIEPLAQGVRPSLILAIGVAPDLTENLRRWAEAHHARLETIEVQASTLTPATVKTLETTQAGLVLLSGLSTEFVGHALAVLARGATGDRPFPVALVDLVDGQAEMRRAVEAFAESETDAYETTVIPAFGGLAILYRKSDRIDPAARALIEQVNLTPLASKIVAMLDREWRQQAAQLELARKRAEGFDRVMRDNQAAMADISNQLIDARAETASLQTQLSEWVQSPEGRVARKLRQVTGYSPRLRRIAGGLAISLWRLRPAWRARQRAMQRRAEEDLALILESGLFDADWYIKTYTDVAGKGSDPALHYLERGLVDRRDPGPHFSTSFYLSRYPDVQESGLNPLVHYMRHGKAESRQTTPHGMDTADLSTRRRTA